VVWQEHDPCGRSWSRQYMPAIFVHDDEQRKIAEQSQRSEADRRGSKIRTPILTLGRFYPAEDYHQKYRLRRSAALMKELAPLYATEAAFREAPLTARLNAFLDGQLGLPALERDLQRLVESPELRRRILELAKKGG
jgi:peptide-methionine (S)-S-oxide reductase